MTLLTATALIIASIICLALLTTDAPTWLGTALLIVGGIYALWSAAVVLAHDERLTKWLGERFG